MSESGISDCESLYKHLQKQTEGPYGSQLTADDAVTQLHWELPADAEQNTLHLRNEKKKKKKKVII